MRPVLLRLRYRVLGGHVHCRLFTAPAGVYAQTWALCGQLVFRLDEWYWLRERFATFMELLEEG